MNPFPFIPPKLSIIVLRISLAVIFLIHAIVRIATRGSIDDFAKSTFNKIWFITPKMIVWGITSFEIIGGIMLICDIFVRWVSTGFIILLLMGIIIIHAQLGWFVGEFGTGGCEYSFILIMAFIVVAATDIKSFPVC